MEIFVDPRVLSCLHSYCKRCAQRLVKQEGDRHVINCPNCRKDTEVSDGKIEELQVNFFLNNLISQLSLHKNTQAADSATITCDDCSSGDPVVARCNVCCHFLCDFCSQAHRRKKLTSNHKLTTLDELKCSGPSALSKPAFCKIHEGEPLKLYCESCEATICRDCIVIEHRDHKYQFVKDVYSKEKNAVNQLLEDTKAKQMLLRDAVEGVVEMGSLVQKARLTVAQQINVSIDRRIQLLEDNRNKLQEQAKEIERGKLKSLEMQQEELQLALGNVSSSIEFIEKALRDGSQVEVLSIKKRMMDRLRDLNTGTQPLEPCTDDVILYKEESMEAIVNKVGRVFDSQSDAKHCVLRTKGDLKIGKEIKMLVHGKDQHGRKRYVGGDDVSIEIKTRYESDELRRIEVTDNGDGTYRASYTPRNSGIHRVFVQVNGADVLGSPFNRNVKEAPCPKYSTLRMGIGEEGEMYDTLVNQTREFTVVTRDSKVNLIRDNGIQIQVKIQHHKQCLNDIPVHDIGNGQYQFYYRPVSPGNYLVSVKLNDDNINGSPFNWKVEEWALSRGENLYFSENNMTVEGACRGFEYNIRGSAMFSSGCHAWKAKAIQGSMYKVGVTDFGFASMWVYSERFEPGRICSVYLNLNKRGLTVQHLPSKETETFNFQSFNVFMLPCFTICGKSKLSLFFEN